MKCGLNRFLISSRNIPLQHFTNLLPSIFFFTFQRFVFVYNLILEKRFNYCKSSIKLIIASALNKQCSLGIIYLVSCNCCPIFCIPPSTFQNKNTKSNKSSSEAGFILALSFYNLTLTLNNNSNMKEKQIKMERKNFSYWSCTHFC